MSERVHLSIVSPVFLAEGILERLVNGIISSVGEHFDSYEIILVDDGSSDGSWNEIKVLSEKYMEVKGVKLSRNFGQHMAVTAGLESANGDNIVIMDCDMQDDPKVITSLMEYRLRGYEIVFTERVGRKHSFHKILLSYTYNLMFRLFADKAYSINTGSLVVFSRTVKEALLKMGDHDRLYIQMLKWVGFSSITIPIEHRSRELGKSSYTFSKLLQLAWQGYTSHSNRLLNLNIFLGILISVLSFLLILFLFYRYLVLDILPGWTSVIVCILFVGGVMMIGLGILGIYIGKIFDLVKDRPLYVVEKRINFDGKAEDT